MAFDTLKNSKRKFTRGRQVPKIPARLFIKPLKIGITGMGTEAESEDRAKDIVAAVYARVQLSINS